MKGVRSGQIPDTSRRQSHRDFLVNCIWVREKQRRLPKPLKVYGCHHPRWGRSCRQSGMGVSGGLHVLSWRILLDFTIGDNE